MGRKKLTKNPKTRLTTSGRPLTEIQREAIIQVYGVTGNKSETARQLGVSQSTVYSVLREAAKAPIKLRQARAEAVEELAGRVHAKAEMVLDSITPADLETGRIEQYDDKGNLIGIRLWGPTLLQKVTSVAVLADKTKVLSDLRESLRSAHDSGVDSMPLPQDVDTALRQIAQKVKRLRLLDVQFQDNPANPPDLTEKLQEAVIVETLVDEDDARASVFDEFDGG
jgi:aminoglycoside phosphotransferase